MCLLYSSFKLGLLLNAIPTFCPIVAREAVPIKKMAFEREKLIIAASRHKAPKF